MTDCKSGGCRCGCNCHQYQRLQTVRRSSRCIVTVAMKVVLVFMVMIVVHSDDVSFPPLTAVTNDDAVTTATSSTLLFNITNFILVNCDTGLDILIIEPNMIIDTTSLGSESLTIRATTTATPSTTDESENNSNDDGDDSSISASTTKPSYYILLDIDNGISRRIESIPPYLLAGKEVVSTSIPVDVDGTTSTTITSFKYHPSNLLQTEGWHIVIATPVSTMNVLEPTNENSFTRRFFIQHGTAVSSSPSSSTDTNTTITADSGTPNTGIVTDNDVVLDSQGCETAMSTTTACLTITNTSHIGHHAFNNSAATDVRPLVADRFGQWNTIRSVWINRNDTSVNATTTTFYTTTKILAFSGPLASERGVTDPGVEYRNPSTFADYRCDLIITFNSSNVDNKTAIITSTLMYTNSTSINIVYPCYYSGTGNAANTGDVGGVVWQCPIRMKTKPWFNGITLYSWKVSFVSGTNIATTTYLGGSHGNPAEFFHQQMGTLSLDMSDGMYSIAANETEAFPTSLSFYTGLYASDFLNFIDFDGIPSSSAVNIGNTYSSYNSYLSNASRFIQDRPTWGGGRGSGIIGAITKIHETTNINVLGITTLSMANDVFPFVEPYNDRLSYDVSKLAQWEVAFRYAADIGLSIILNLNEDSILDYEEQHLYVREMVARFGQYVTAYTVGSLQTAHYIRELNGNQHITISASILWRINTNTEVVSLSEYVHSVDGILMLMSNPSGNTIYDHCKDWKRINPQISIFISAVIPVLMTRNQKGYSDLIWSTVFAGGAGVFIDPNRNSEEKTENEIMDRFNNDAFILNDPSISATLNILEQRFASLTTLKTLCNDILVSTMDLRCLSDVTFNHIVIYLSSNSTDKVWIKQQFWSDTSLQYSVEWVDLTTGKLETTDVTVVSSNQTGLGTLPSAANNWIALLTCYSGCVI